LSEIAFKCVLDRKVIHIELPDNTSAQESSFIEFLYFLVVRWCYIVFNISITVSVVTNAM